MIKKLISAVLSLAALVTSALAITPDTIGVYEKIDQIVLVELSNENMTYVYFICGLVCLLMVAFYLWDRRKRKQLKNSEQQDDE